MEIWGSPFWFGDPQIGLGIHLIYIPILVRGSPFWYGDSGIPVLVWGSPNRFGDSFDLHPHIGSGIPEPIRGSPNRFGDPQTKMGIPKPKYNACPNEIDMNGSSALLEATKYGHEQVEDLLLKAGAKLCIQESQAASILCQAVFDGNIMLLKRLVKAGINVNAADYDKRTASHIAAAEGNTAAIRVLVEGGADLTIPDRWGNTARLRTPQHVLELLDI
jgi:hypothetical protein